MWQNMAVSCSPWHVLCRCNVPGALGFVVFRTLTLGRALKATWGEAGANEKGVGAL